MCGMHSPTNLHKMCKMKNTIKFPYISFIHLLYWQASVSFGSQWELDESKVKHEQQECNPIGHEGLRALRVEPLPSIQKLTNKDIEREQCKLKVKLPSFSKGSPKSKEKRSTTERAWRSIGSFKVLTHSLIKRKTHYYYKCKVGNCKASFNRVKSWNIHHLVKHKSMKYKCSKCNKFMSTLCRYRDHLNLHKVTKFTCHKYDRKFIYACRLKLNLHRRVKMHSCFASGCQKRYKWPQDLECHVKSHLKEVLYECRLCNYTSYEGRLYRRHVIVHTNLLP